MKTAISLPDATFEEAEQLAKRLGMSRSELYTTALETFLNEHRSKAITAKLNEVYADEDSELEPFWRQVRDNSLRQDQW